MKIALLYDCLYPYTVGGGERWYRAVVERLAGEGHEVTYVTMRQWPYGEAVDVPGVRVVPVAPRLALYTVGGRRRIGPPLVFGVGVLWHLLRYGDRYDVVHTAAFPYFSLLAAWAASAPRRRQRLIVDWFEVWTRDYWREYLGFVGGTIGWLVQRLCARLGTRAFCLSRMHARRLRKEGFRGEISILDGLYASEAGKKRDAVPEPVVVFAGRHTPEKRVPAIVAALVQARKLAPELRAELYGDGPDRARVLELIRLQGLEPVVEAPGFVDAERVHEALARALCMVLPSRREGYGLVVVEAAALGTPSVVVSGPDNAATELVENGRNGVVASSAEPAELAAAILRVRDAGPSMRASTAKWFAENRSRLSLERSLERVIRAYAGV